MDYPEGPPCGWDRFTEDTLVTERPCWLYGVVVSDNAAGVTVVFDGRNANGRRMFSLRTILSVVETLSVMFPHPLPVRNGLFVDIPAGVDDVLVAWRPMEDPPAPEPPASE